MVSALKKKIYFFVAYYFRIFAKIQLLRWRPRVIVVTGSSGKTTLLHLIESQLKEKARYSYHANSTFGLPFDILDLNQEMTSRVRWLWLFAAAPFRAFKKPYTEKIYVAEVDCDRPGEGKFLGSLLRPEVTLWLNSGSTHTVNFDHVVKQRKFSSVEAAIAYEFGYLAQYAGKLVIANGDNPLMLDQLERAKAVKKIVTRRQLKKYTVSEKGTQFIIDGITYATPFLLPEDSFYAIAMANALVSYLGLAFDKSLSNFTLPPGRSSAFKGFKNTTLIDSSYNATPDGVAAILNMFSVYVAKNKWLVLGDMIELGKEEQEEHEKLVPQITAINAKKIVFVGPRISKYTYGLFRQSGFDAAPEDVVAFEYPADGLKYIQENIKGGETILFKGARFLEGVVEHLLADKNDVDELCRREKVWQERRKKWGL